MMSSGSLTHRATLDGSTEGITCIEFNPTVRTTLRFRSSENWIWIRISSCDVMSVDSVQDGRILAASYDKSAVLWQRDEPVPKVTMTIFYTF